jgi:cytochrome P450
MTADRGLQFVIGALFAGQLNSGINAAWVLSYLADNPQWMARAREEVVAVSRKHNPDSKSSLVDQLANVPVEAWETEFKFLDCCLKDSIRLQLLGTAFRQNISEEDIQIGDEIVPPGAFLVSKWCFHSQWSETSLSVH